MEEEDAYTSREIPAASASLHDPLRGLHIVVQSTG